MQQIYFGFVLFNYPVNYFISNLFISFFLLKCFFVNLMYHHLTESIMLLILLSEWIGFPYPKSLPVLFCSSGAQTQSFTHARHMLYGRTTPPPSLLFYWIAYSIQYFRLGMLHLLVLRGVSWFCTQESFRNPMVYQGLKLGVLCTRQEPYPLYYLSGPIRP